MIALQAFVGVVGGVEVRFPEGAVIDPDDAAEMNLDEKPELAEAEE